MLNRKTTKEVEEIKKIKTLIYSKKKANYQLNRTNKENRLIESKNNHLGLTCIIYSYLKNVKDKAEKARTPML